MFAFGIQDSMYVLVDNIEKKMGFEWVGHL